MTVDRTRAGRPRALAPAVPLLPAVISPAIAAAQQPAAGKSSARPLSLDEAIRLAARESEALQIARAGVTRANGQQKQARSLYLPQGNSSLHYARTLRSPFSALASSSTDPSTTPAPQAVCAPTIPANATPAERQAALNQASTC